MLSYLCINKRWYTVRKAPLMSSYLSPNLVANFKGWSYFALRVRVCFGVRTRGQSSSAGRLSSSESFAICFGNLSSQTTASGSPVPQTSPQRYFNTSQAKLSASLLRKSRPETRLVHSSQKPENFLSNSILIHISFIPSLQLRRWLRTCQFWGVVCCGVADLTRMVVAVNLTNIIFKLSCILFL